MSINFLKFLKISAKNATHSAGAPNSAKFRGGCRGPSNIRQRGGCNNFSFLRVKNRTF